MRRATRRLAAIMFTDVVGYTALMAESESRGLRARARHRAIVGPLVRRYGGELLEIRGDECFAVFASALDAVNCALAIQGDVDREPDLTLHVGIHLGDVVIEGGEASGDGVNITSRLSSLSEGGGILVSGEVHNAVRNQAGIEAVSIGEHDFKNVGRPIDVYRIAGAPAALRATATRRARAGAGARFAYVAVSVVIAAALLWLWQARTSSAGAIRSIAVLPLDNLSGDPAQEYVADGMTEALITDLAKLGSLRVISRTSMMTYKGAERLLPEIAEALGVDAVVEGSVQIVGDRVRIYAQLIEADSDHHLWAEQYDRDVRDVLSLQREIARAIAREIELTLAPHEQRSLGEARRVDPEAHAAYLKALHFQRQHTPEASDKAIRYFDHAIAIDPEFALSYAGKADTFSCAPMHAWTMPQGGTWPAIPHQVMQLASSAAQTAIEIEPDLAEAHIALGLVRLFGEWDWAGAEQEFRRGLALKPGYAFGHMTYAHFLALVGRFDESRERGSVALSLNPLDTIQLIQIGDLAEWRGDLEAARQSYADALELEPDFAQAHQGLGRILCRSGGVAQALVAFERARSLQSDDPMIAADLAYCYAVNGRPEEARRLLDELAGRSQRMHVTPVALALIHVGLAEPDAALGQLEAAYALRSFHLPDVVRAPSWTPLWEDPRLVDLVASMGLSLKRKGLSVRTGVRAGAT